MCSGALPRTSPRPTVRICPREKGDVGRLARGPVKGRVESGEIPGLAWAELEGRLALHKMAGGPDSVYVCTHVYGHASVCACELAGSR